MRNENRLVAYDEAAARIRENEPGVCAVEVRTSDLEMENGVLRTSGQSFRRSTDADQSLWRLVDLPEPSWTAQQCSGRGLFLYRRFTGGGFPQDPRNRATEKQPVKLARCRYGFLDSNIVDHS